MAVNTCRAVKFKGTDEYCLHPTCESAEWHNTAMNSEWTKPRGLPLLSQGEVQVWRIDLTSGQTDFQTSDFLEHAYKLLNANELERAARMRPGIPRDEFIAGRGSLRLLLGSAVTCDPRMIAFRVGTHGKPELCADHVRLPTPSFNVTHSRGMILIALSYAGALGVDVEVRDTTVEALEVARASLHDSDVRRIEAAGTEDDRISEFYRCWTRREAVAKCDGRGLTLGAYAVWGDEANDSEQPVNIPADRDGDAAVVYAQGINLESDYCAALACDQPRLCKLQFDLDLVQFAAE